MKERNTVSRRVAIGLGATCIILVAGLVGVFAYDTMKLNERADYMVQLEISLLQTKNQKSELQNQLDERASYIVQLETWLQEAKDANSSLQNQMDDYVANHHHNDSEYNLLQSIVNIEKQETILDQYTLNTGPNTHSFVASVQTDYAGYLELSMTSTTPDAYVIVEFGFEGQLFSFERTLGTSGLAYFCILPPGAAIYAGNKNPVDGATHTITATYHY